MGLSTYHWKIAKMISNITVKCFAKNRLDLNGDTETRFQD